MIIKSEEFNAKFLRDVYEILINTKFPPNIVGSYKIKKNGALITDIDVSQLIFATDSFLKRLVSIVNSVRNFKFIHLICGQYDAFKLPWKFDDEGSCEYDEKTVKIWGKNLKNHIPSELYIKIKNILSSNTLCIKDLFTIRDLLKDYSRIIWSKKDLENGYKEYFNKKYYFLESIKQSHTTLAVYLYKFKNDFCTVDSSFVDKNYAKYSPSIYDYYMENKYRMFKSLKRMIKPEYFEEFKLAVEKLEKYSAVNSAIFTVELMKKYNLENKDTIEFQIKKIETFSKQNKIEIPKLKEKIEEISLENIKYFETKLSEKFKSQYILFKIRAKEGTAPIIETEKRERNETKVCPFFIIQFQELNKLIDIALRAMISPEKLVDCVKKVCIKQNINAKELINTIFSKEKLEIKQIGKEYFFNHKKITADELKKKQIEVIFQKK